MPVTHSMSQNLVSLVLPRDNSEPFLQLRPLKSSSPHHSCKCPRQLQHSKTPASTKELTDSFGWGSSDAIMQHDVQVGQVDTRITPLRFTRNSHTVLLTRATQELNRVLCEKLEEKMKVWVP